MLGFKKRVTKYITLKIITKIKILVFRIIMSKTLFVCQEGDYERPQGGLLVNAAINITRAVSQFMGLVLQVSIYSQTILC